MSNLLSGTPAYLFEALQQLANLCHCTTSLNAVIVMAVRDHCDKVEELVERYKSEMLVAYNAGWLELIYQGLFEVAEMVRRNQYPLSANYRGFDKLDLGRIQVCRLELKDLRRLAIAASDVADELLNVHSEEWTEVDDDAHA